MAQMLTTESGQSVKDLQLKEGEVRPHDTVKVYATGKNPYAKDGDVMEVHPELAKKLVAKGFASEGTKSRKADA